MANRTLRLNDTAGGRDYSQCTPQQYVEESALTGDLDDRAVRLAGLRGDEVVLDMACGVGSIGLRADGPQMLGSRGRQVYYVDKCPGMVEVVAQRMCVLLSKGGL